MNGWIKLWDIPEDHWLNSDIKFYGAWVKLIRKAEIKDGKKVIRGTMIDAKRGTVYASANQLSKEWGVTRRMVHHFLELCEADGMVNVQRMSNRFLIIKVNNYAKFQDRPNGRCATDRTTDRTTESTTESTTDRIFFLTNKQKVKKNRSGFSDFPQRETNYDEIFKRMEGVK